MRHFRKNLPAVILVLLLAGFAAGWYATRPVNRSSAKPAGKGAAALVDDRLLQTARQMAARADSTEEQPFAHEALRLSDHEFDQAFASAIREASAAAAPVTGPLKQLADRVAALKAKINVDQGLIAKLGQAAEANDAAASRLELAKAQLSLDEDELGDAQEDLDRAGGDRRSMLVRAEQAHEAAEHEGTQPKIQIAGPATTLANQVQVWFGLWNRGRQIDTARQQASNKAATLGREHQTLEALLGQKPVPSLAADSGVTDDNNEGETAEDAQAMLARLRQLSDQRKTLAELDKRIQDCEQLAENYQRWGVVLDNVRGAVLHAMLFSLAIVAAILLVAFAIGRLIRHMLTDRTDRKRLHQLRVMATIAVQAVALLVILLVVFGTPTQTSTIIGLTTAGLTVVLKDFIVAFFGWFVLMGKNGIRVGDWVEIEGVGGEVIEIGLLKTVLLEMGNWTNTGHPTGRHVAFVNKYAIENHYFNFSTAGQWLWDELQMTLPSSGDPYEMAMQIRNVIERETEADAKQAEQDWERVTRQYGTRPFSARPAIDLRPSANGLDVIVRYITRAPQRYDVKSRLFQAIVEMLHRPGETGSLRATS